MLRRVGGVAVDRDDASREPEVLRAAAALARGELVILPTETVYGLAAAADDPVAVRRVFEVKQRPAEHPLIVHLDHAADLDAWAREIPPEARTLASTHWPGPLTLLLRRSARAHDGITGGRDTVALRVPRHRLTLAVIRALGAAVVAPSANPFGRVSPTTAAHAAADLGAEVSVVLDGGACSEGVESTILDLSADAPVLLRPGALPLEALESTLGRRIEHGGGPSRAPGMLAAHYAPRCRVELHESTRSARSRAERLARDGVRVEVLDLSRDVAAYARELYARLREADAAGAEVVVAVMPDPAGVGRAVRDRLHKASMGSGNPES
jgi:L-threonylcarbamoyladenylate synthase